MYKIFWNQEALIKNMAMISDIATKKGAGVIAERAIRNLQKFTLLPSSESTGELEAHIGIMKQRYNTKNEVGWLAGVFDPKGQSGEWEDSMGARAAFLEYGHAFPYGGRKPGKSRKLIIKSVKPYPYLRPAAKSSARAIHAIFMKEIAKRW